MKTFTSYPLITLISLLLSLQESLSFTIGTSKIHNIQKEQQYTKKSPLLWMADKSIDDATQNGSVDDILNEIHASGYPFRIVVSSKKFDKGRSRV